jgi:3-hydroxybutyrate dehydrogenase
MNMANNGSLQGRVALVTGSTSGIGLGIAETLASQGADIMLNGFGDPQQIASLTQSLASQHGVRVHYHPADMSKPNEIEDLIRSTESTLGRCDILVNNAGIQHVAPVESFPVDRWDAIIAINLSSAFHTIRCALPG